MKREPDLVKKLINSVAPNIYGHEDIKMAVLLAMFGGVERTTEDTHRVRGDINVLIMGDPGTAKSQFLKSVQNAFYRCIYTTGKGASAVGLTASVKRDFATNEWVLEAGALVLADKGICLIDEFDKMNEKDRTSIHEAMEQQSISISKAGIVTSLRARCSVIAAANPIQGRYNPQQSFRDNVDLTDPILSRFDILCVVRDDVDREVDHDLSTFVINQHMKTHPIAKKFKVMNELLDVRQDNSVRYDLMTLKNYIKYARDTCQPQLTNANTEIIKQFYMQLRAESVGTGGINIAVRHIESLIRMSIGTSPLLIQLMPRCTCALK
jgi:DNA replication licensing factor MCM2